MRSLSRLDDFGAAMAVVVPDCYHYWRPVQTAPYLIWAEESGGGTYANNQHDEQSIRGNLHYFTRTEFDSAVDSIQTALNDFGASWALESVQFEEETNLIHYEWAWEVL